MVVAQFDLLGIANRGLRQVNQRTNVHNVIWLGNFSSNLLELSRQELDRTA